MNEYLYFCHLFQIQTHSSFLSFLFGSHPVTRFILERFDQLLLIFVYVTVCFVLAQFCCDFVGLSLFLYTLYLCSFDYVCLSNLARPLCHFWCIGVISLSLFLFTPVNLYLYLLALSLFWLICLICLLVLIQSFFYRSASILEFLYNNKCKFLF